VGCFLGLWCFDHFVEIFVTNLVVVSLFSAVLTMNYDSVFSASTSSRWLLLVLNRDSDRLTLICVPFVFVIA
jgi:hypothetical protein